MKTPARTVFARAGGRLAFALASAVLFGAAASAQPVQFKVEDGGNGHYYEVITACGGITWDAANVAANLKSFATVPGHLATSRSAAEDVFIDDLRHAVLSASACPGRSQAWIGGFQALNQATPGAGWQWVNGEGPIPGMNSADPYANWAGGEPNDGDGIENNAENHLTLGRFAVRGWNDEGTAPQLIGGYIVEYDTEVNVADCIQTGDCSPLEAQSLQLPPTTQFDDDSTITFEINEFIDSRFDESTGVCHDDNDPLEPLRPFGDNALVIPWYLCGSPEYIVVKTDAPSVAIAEGTVLVAHDKLDDNLYECVQTTNDPLQHRDVIVWQSTNPEAMLENGGTAASISPELVGAAGEFTDGCGSSLGRSRGASYYIIGMHINFGVDWDLDALTVFERFVQLTRYKLLLLQDAIEAARPFLKSGDYSKLRRQVRNTIRQLDRRDYNGALSEISNAVKFVEAAVIGAAPDGFNHEGELLMRSLNIRFMLSDKIIPNEP